MIRVAWLLFFLGYTQIAVAQEVTHVLRRGETLSLLAKHYYGNTWKAAYIAGRNKISNIDEVAPDTQLKIPASWSYTVRRGDTLSKIAKKYLGHGDRFNLLMTENGIKHASELKPGRQLLMPFHIAYTVQPGDSLTAIALRFYRSTRRAERIRQYNAETEHLQPNQRLIIPIFDRSTLLVAKKRPPKTPDPNTKPSKGQQRALLNGAVDHYWSGDFSAACGTFDELLSYDPHPSNKGILLRFLGFCAVAQGDPENAEAYFRDWLHIDPTATLDPIRTSPKIITAFDAATKTVHLKQN